jgi:eukaryotic-like serine/threonine-protein kinase
VGAEGSHAVLEDDAVRSATATRLAGEVLGGRYRILRRIGAGGMADVFEVVHVRLDGTFAAKVLREHRDGSVRRFLREARLLARLKSDHIVTVFDVSDPNDGAPYYVMELLSGQDLRRLLKATPELSIERAVKIITDACSGIGVAHAAGLVHRDLKPENLFVTHRDSGEEVVKLLDFGVAKADEGTSTEHGALIGTVRYMAPEQIEHAGVVSARADVRGLGAILYECLTGRPPHVADSVERLFFKILNERVGPVRAFRKDVPEELDEVVLRALERDPVKRFSTAAEFADALRPFVGTTKGRAAFEAATTLREDAATPKRRQRRSMGVWLGVVGLCVAALTGARVFGGSDEVKSARDEPERSPAPAETTLPKITGAELPPTNEPVADSRAVPTASVAPPPEMSTPPVRNRGRVPQRTTRSAPVPPTSAAPEPPQPDSFARIDSRNPYEH